MDRLKRQMEFICKADEMKNIFRQSLILDGTRRENDAEHSWHIALMALTLAEYAPEGTDISRAVKMAVLHDLIEVYAGDTPAYDAAGNESREERENAAADRIFGLLPPCQAAEFRGLWEEFDRADTPESVYAAAVDRLQPFISNYLTGGLNWKQWNVTVEMVIKRLEPVRNIPKLWEYAQEIITESAEKGLLKPSENHRDTFRA